MRRDVFMSHERARSVSDLSHRFTMFESQLLKYRHIAY